MEVVLCFTHPTLLASTSHISTSEIRPFEITRITFVTQDQSIDEIERYVRPPSKLVVYVNHLFRLAADGSQGEPISWN